MHDLMKGLDKGDVSKLEMFAKEVSAKLWDGGAEKYKRDVNSKYVKNIDGNAASVKQM